MQSEIGCSLESSTLSQPWLQNSNALVRLAAVVCLAHYPSPGGNSNALVGLAAVSLAPYPSPGGNSNALVRLAVVSR
jgi:hypothetical protein